MNDSAVQRETHIHTICRVERVGRHGPEELGGHSTPCSPQSSCNRRGEVERFVLLWGTILEFQVRPPINSSLSPPSVATIWCRSCSATAHSLLLHPCSLPVSGSDTCLYSRAQACTNREVWTHPDRHLSARGHKCTHTSMPVTHPVSLGLPNATLVYSSCKLKIIHASLET